MNDLPHSLATWLLAALLAAASLAGAAPARPLALGATIFPAADIARRIAGPGIRVVQVLPAGASPHTFDLAPGNIREMQGLAMIFKIGVLDDWIDGIADSLPQATLVALNRGIALLPSREGAHGHGAGKRHDAGETDPHYWLSAANGKLMARNIADSLKALAPSRAAAFEEHYREFAAEMDLLHAELKKELSGLRDRKMVVFHDGWRYFAAAYGLEIAAVFQASPGREPSPRDLQALYAMVRKHGIKVVFSEPQLPEASLEPLLQDLGMELVVLDPLGGSAANDSYSSLLRRNARAVLSALRR